MPTIQQLTDQPPPTHEEAYAIDQNWHKLHDTDPPWGIRDPKDKTPPPGGVTTTYFLMMMHAYDRMKPNYPPARKRLLTLWRHRNGGKKP